MIRRSLAAVSLALFAVAARAEDAIPPEMVTAIKAATVFVKVDAGDMSGSGTTATAHVNNTYQNGDWVSIQGSDSAACNGWFKIFNVTTSSFDYTVPAETAQPSASSGTRVRIMTDQTQTTYDLAGEPLTSTDQRGVTHAYAYNSDGQQISDSVTNSGSVPSAGQTVAAIVTDYDDIGRVETVTSYTIATSNWDAANTVNQIQYAYDGWGNEIQEWRALTGAVDRSSTPSVQYMYGDGAVDRVAQYVRLTDVIYPAVPGTSSGRDISYGYGQAEPPTFAQTVDNIMSRLATISESNGTVDAAYTYLGADTIASETYEQPQIDLDYSAENFAALDRFGNVLQQVWASDGAASGNAGTLDGYSYTYDESGNRTSDANLKDAVLSETYRYDSLDRLISSNRADGVDQTWTLDALGNLASVTKTGTPTQTTTSTAANEIQTINGSAATSAYDLAGNMTTTPEPSATGGALTCVYDAWNRLVQVSAASTGTIQAKYQYDGTGRQIGRTDTTYGTGGTTTTQRYVFDGTNMVLAFDGNGNLTDRYLWGPAVDQVLADEHFTISGTPTNQLPSAPGNTLWALGDNQNSVRDLVNDAGTLEQHVAYSPFGQQVAAQSSNPGNVAFAFGYTGTYTDSVTADQLHGVRWYDPASQRWLTQDPAAADVNLYRYCGNAPTNWVDPSGLRAVGKFSALLTSMAVNGTEEDRWESDNSISWSPPKNERGEVTTNCQQVRLFQMVDTHHGRNGRWPFASSDFPWHDDTEGLIAQGCLTDWNSDGTQAVLAARGVVGQSPAGANIHDFPGISGGPGWFQYSLKQQFTVAAVCIDVNSPEFGEVYGEVHYSEYIYSVDTVMNEAFKRSAQGAKYNKRYEVQGAAIQVSPDHWVGNFAKEAFSNDMAPLHDRLEWSGPGYKPDPLMLADITEWIRKNYPNSKVAAHW